VRHTVRTRRETPADFDAAHQLHGMPLETCAKSLAPPLAASSPSARGAMDTSAIASQRARLRPFAGAIPQAFDKALTVADAP
jgi:hypothetical protein